MATNRVRILIVSTESQTVAEMTAGILPFLDAEVTVVDTLDEAAVLMASDAFEVILASRLVGGEESLSLLDSREAGRSVPFILLTDNLDTHQALEAMRHGAAEIFGRPFDTSAILAAVRRLIERRREQKLQATRHLRLRRLSSRLIRDRRELRQRVDLICRDVVHAYRRLVEKTVQLRDQDFPTTMDHEDYQAEL